MYPKYRPLLPQIAFNANTYGKSTPIQTWLSRIVCIDCIQVALVGAFILQTSFDKRTRVLLYTHDVVHHSPALPLEIGFCHQQALGSIRHIPLCIGKGTNKIGNKEELCKKNRSATKKVPNWDFLDYIMYY